MENIPMICIEIHNVTEVNGQLPIWMPYWTSTTDALVLYLKVPLIACYSDHQPDNQNGQKNE